MRTRKLRFIVALLVSVSLCGCAGEGQWQGTARFDHEVTIAEAMYVTDPNAAVGLCVVYAETDADPERDDAVGMGLVTRFALGPVIEAALNLMLPGNYDVETIPARPWGTLGFGWNFDANHDWWSAGTGLEFLLTETIRPYVSTDIVAGLGVNETARIMTGVIVEFP